MEEQIMNMPAVALRGLTILPGMIAHFDISRERSLRAVEEAMEQDQKIYLVTQRNVDSEDPTQEDLYQMGIVADIKQVVRLQNDVVRILVDGISRAALLGFTGNEKYLDPATSKYSKSEGRSRIPRFLCFFHCPHICARFSSARRSAASRSTP